MIYAWCCGYIIDTYLCCCMGLNQFPAVWSWEKQMLSTTVTRATYWKLVISYFSIFCNVCIFTLIYIFLFTHVNQCKSLVDCCFVQHRPVCCAVHIFAHVLMAADVMRILCCSLHVFHAHFVFVCTICLFCKKSLQTGVIEIVGIVWYYPGPSWLFARSWSARLCARCNCRPVDHSEFIAAVWRSRILTCFRFKPWSARHLNIQALFWQLSAEK